MKSVLRVSEQRLLLFSVFVLSLCGIIYELVLGSLATYLLGNPVQQYSITIGFFLFSMGLGSWFSRFFVNDLLRTFITVEVTLGVVGGVSVALLSYLFSFETSYYLLHVFFLIAVGTLVGLEIPLITRIMRSYG
ncbi:MAG: polyamine aminopropyltransferase, partial [Spirochaetes bacterium]|nr:polyamine aminopropyltransferase [Spirochaetota bacterium]